MHRLLISFALLLCLCAPLAAQAESPLILRSPTVSRDAVAFVFAGDIWLVGRGGGDARRLTTGVGTEATPYFSPDGKLIAFTGEYEGNADVYVVEASGGVPRRLTYHPGADIAQGWTPDGGAVLFRSGRDSANFTPRLFTMPLAGGHPSEIPLPQASEASYSPDGRRLAYVPLARAFQMWKKYRGGRTTPIWVADLADSSIEKLPRENSNDFNPMWVGDRVYFLSDRGGAVTIYAYDARTRRVEQVVKNTGMDIKSAAAGDGVIVYEQFGSLHTLDLGSGRTQALAVRVEGDLPSVRPRFARVGTALRNASLSPSGARALFEARGEVITVPAEKGDARNLTNTPGVAERDPAWSPDGKWVAYFSDESGEYALHLRSQSGMGEVKKIGLGNPPSYFYSPVWSPDSKKVAYTDKRLNLWYVDVSKAGAAPVRVDANTYDNPFRVVDPSWSPDSRFIAYTKQMKNRLGTVFIYALEENKTRQVTDNMSDARFARFDREGKHLYFTASTNAGPSSGWLDMSSFDRPVTRSAYVVVLRKDLPSPLAPESDEEKVTEEQKTNNPDDKGEPKPGPPQPPPAPLSSDSSDVVAEAGDAGYLAAGEPATTVQQPPQGGPGGPGRGGAGAAAKPPEPVRIDFDGIDQRVLALPLPARDYSGLYAGKPGTFFLLEDVTGPEVTGRVLHRFEMSKRRAEKVTEGVVSFDLSANGEKMLLGLGGPGFAVARWLIVSATQPLRPGEGAINTAALEVRVEPRAEWRQMYKEAWRIQRDFFYDPNYHGLDIAATEKRYEPYLE
ncbi:MAG: protease, partial [Pyrinomonadaceae bacterium]